MNNIEVPELSRWLKSTDYTGPVGLTCKSYIKPERVDDYKSLIKEQLEETVKEPGVLHIKFNSDFESDSIFWLVEEWKSPAALLEHLSSPSFKDEVLAKCKPMMRQPMQAALYKINN